VIGFQYGIYGFQVDPDPEQAVERPGIDHVQGVFGSLEFTGNRPNPVSCDEFAIIYIIQSGSKTSDPFIMPGIGNVSEIDIRKIVHIVQHQVIRHTLMKVGGIVEGQIQVIVGNAYHLPPKGGYPGRMGKIQKGIG
jgi:hypothetical protein